MSLLSDEHRRNLVKSKPAFCQQLHEDLLLPLLDLLLKYKVLSPISLDSITSQKLQYEKASYLVDLISRGSQEKFNDFCKALEEEDIGLGIFADSFRTGTKIHAKPVKPVETPLTGKSCMFVTREHRDLLLRWKPDICTQMDGMKMSRLMTYLASEGALTQMDRDAVIANRSDYTQASVLLDYILKGTEHYYDVLLAGVRSLGDKPLTIICEKIEQGEHPIRQYRQLQAQGTMMTQDHLDIIRKLKPQICEKIPKHKLQQLILVLQAAGVLSAMEARFIQQENKTRYAQVGDVLDSLSKGPNRNFKKFCQALESPDVELCHLAEALRKNTTLEAHKYHKEFLDREGLDWKIMTREHVDTLLYYRKELSEGISQSQLTRLIPALEKGRVLVCLEAEFLQEEHCRRYEQIGEMVINITKGPDRYFSLFCEALRDVGCTHLAELLVAGTTVETHYIKHVATPPAVQDAPPAELSVAMAASADH